MIALATPDNRIDALPLGVVLHGDALAVLKTMESNSVDAIVTDPPAGISFMGKEWDTFSPEYLEKMAERETKRKSLGSQEHNGIKKKRSSSAFGDPAHYAGSYDFSRKGRDAFIKFMTDIMAEALRVLRPGGHALVWALPRTSHWTALALEDAGFEVRDAIFHHFGSGFPKSTAIDKQIDKMLGAEREVIGIASDFARDGCKRDASRHQSRPTNQVPDGDRWALPVTKPATPEAQQWAGYGTALKPSTEIWWLVRKPLAEPSIAANVLKYGVGGINVDACRVGGQAYSQEQWNKKEQARTTGNTYGVHKPSLTEVPQGRWPANLLLSHSLWCIPQGTKRVRVNDREHVRYNHAGNQGYHGNVRDFTGTGYADSDGMEEVEAWQCAEDCPIYQLDLQSGVRKSGAWPKRVGPTMGYHGHASGYETEARIESGTTYASRYFTNLPPDVPFLYTSKASRAERNRGCEGLPKVKGGSMSGGEETRPDRPTNHPIRENHHPTVKPLALMRWLIRLITPPDGIVLDPFCGSGSTCVAAIQEGVHFIAIEQSEEYCQIAEARIAHARGLPDILVNTLTRRELEAWGNVLDALFPEEVH